MAFGGPQRRKQEGVVWGNATIYCVCNAYNILYLDDRSQAVTCIESFSVSDRFSHTESCVRMERERGRLTPLIKPVRSYIVRPNKDLKEQPRGWFIIARHPNITLWIPLFKVADLDRSKTERKTICVYIYIYGPKQQLVMTFNWTWWIHLWGSDWTRTSVWLYPFSMQFMVWTQRSMLTLVSVKCWRAFNN